MANELWFLREDSGNCRWYYRRKSTGTLFCIQNDGSWGKDNFKFYVCSRDGEPSHEVAWPEGLAVPGSRP